jgi:hypothetical protein
LATLAALNPKHRQGCDELLFPFGCDPQRIATFNCRSQPIQRISPTEIAGYHKPVAELKRSPTIEELQGGSFFFKHSFELWDAIKCCLQISSDFIILVSAGKSYYIVIFTIATIGPSSCLAFRARFSFLLSFQPQAQYRLF